MNKFIGIMIIVIGLPLSLYFLHRIVNSPSSELFSTLAGAVVGVYFMLYIFFNLKFKPKE